MSAIVRYALAGLGLLFIGTDLATAQFQQKSSVADACGTRAMGGAFTHLGAGGQPGGISVSWDESYVNQAGFLHTFFLQRDLDTDSDGLPDEADLDNDGDKLTDVAELTGTAFSPVTPTDPNRADTDDDGVADSDEALAGTDPTDENVSCRIVEFQHTGGVRRLSWLARGNNERLYIVHRRPDLSTEASQIIYSDRIAGGTPPWYVVTNTIFDASVNTAEFYHVIAAP